MRSLPAALAVIALLALAGCGGSSPDTKTATTATTPGKPAALTQTQLDRVDRTTAAVVSKTPLMQSALNRCIARRQRRKTCVTAAVRPAEAAVARSRKTIATLRAKVGGPCANGVASLAERLSTLTDDLRSLAQVTQQGSIPGTTRLGAGVQTDLRGFAQTSTALRDFCTG